MISLATFLGKEGKGGKIDDERSEESIWGIG
jgi:hypothetical protein